ncbi:PsbB mRNA maturation factor Mbb1 [Dorcoceras hygrometricum]|uniref:PsbB mRNA maturation factor Mbb1 n=1 Tax=Dorcoceras hygrometricum TaxID=472368 RepID=A0A2Z7BMZ2_9LAMI|nr:PsbB mRNA maturation factor Mbb1 [Dorcoceras hygrometricum]
MLERPVLIQSGQSLNVGRYGWYQSRPLLVRCGSGTNQAEAGGHVRSRAQKRAGSDCRCQEVARTMSGSWQAPRGEGSHE